MASSAKTIGQREHDYVIAKINRNEIEKTERTSNSPPYMEKTNKTWLKGGKQQKTAGRVNPTRFWVAGCRF